MLRVGSLFVSQLRGSSLTPGCELTLAGNVWCGVDMPPWLCVWQDNVRFLKTVASLNDVFMKQYHSGYPAPPVTWIVQNFDLDLSQVDPPNAEGYLDSLLKEKGELDSEVESTQVRRSVGKHRRGLTGASHLELYRLFSWRCCSDV